MIDLEMKVEKGQREDKVGGCPHKMHPSHCIHDDVGGVGSSVSVRAI